MLEWCNNVYPEGSFDAEKYIARVGRIFGEMSFCFRRSEAYRNFDKNVVLYNWFLALWVKHKSEKYECYEFISNK